MCLCYKEIGIGYLILIAALSITTFVACNSGKNKENDDDTVSSPRMTALTYLWNGQLDEAELGFKKAIKTDRNNILNYIDLALLYLSKNNFDEAGEQIEEGLKIQPDNTDLRLVWAQLYIRKGEKANAEKQLNQALAQDKKNVAAYYLLAEMAGTEKNAVRKSNLLKITAISPSNMVARLELADLLATEKQADSSLHFLQSIKEFAPEFPPVADSAYQQTISLLRSKQWEQVPYFLQRFRKLMETTRLYAESAAELSPPTFPDAKADFNDSRFSQTGATNEKVSLDDIRFNEVAEKVGLNADIPATVTRSVMGFIDDDGTGNSYIYSGFFSQDAPAKRYLFKRDMGAFTDVAAAVGISHSGEEMAAAFADFDNDGYQDLFISTTKGIILYKNKGDGGFSLVKKNTGLEKATGAVKLVFADFDQDGDLDLYAGAAAGSKFFRNNSDGSFTEQSRSMNLDAGAIDIDYGDWDTDGDPDIVTLSADGDIRLYNNERYSKFTDYTDKLQLSNPLYKGRAIAVGDYNNDGLPDLLLAGSNNGHTFLLKNTGNNGFSPEPFSQKIAEVLKDLNISSATFIDFDNDGHEDILVAGTTADGSSGLKLFHNEMEKGFTDVSRMLPQPLQATQMAIADFNIDGDDDIFLAGPAGIKLVRNDGGSLNRYMQVQLTGLSYASSKNNRLGIGAQVELKAGNLYQLKTIKRSITNFGVGDQDSLEAVRIIWPNGTPQYIGDPARRQKLFEEAKLKGSCPFLFVWNGERYEFLKDMMWRSALGMPVAINGKDTTYAFSDPSKEYLLIPGDKMKPRDNSYSIKITEELWEAVYFDKAALFAVDHPDSVEVFADEKFVAPPFPGKKLYLVAQKIYPAAATDGNGNDVLPEILAYDFRYISHFGLGKYQGLTEGHDLLLDPGKQADTDSLMLFLRGWIFPTDASINTAMTQSSLYKPQPPSLQVINQKGEWQTVIPNIGFPMGKDKMVIVDMTGKFLTADRKIRIRTNMQIYWDEIFFSKGMAKAPVSIQEMPMTKAGLSFRGYSAMYRKGGPFGPHWFDYYQTSGGQQWRDLTGYYTRYGDVLPLLEEADDEYIIANSGDEITIEFDAGKLPPLPAGWKRDFLIYSEGWVKDGDLNTAYGQTVEPLPFHGMPSYPYPANHQYPFEKHKTYREQYNTRKITTEGFMNALKTEQHNTK